MITALLLPPYFDAQSEYNRDCLSSIFDMDFQFFLPYVSNSSSSFEQPKRIKNSSNKFFVHLLFEYCYKAKDLDWYHNTPEIANISP